MRPSGVVILGAEGPDAQVLPDEVPGSLGGKLVERRFPGRMVPIQPVLQREAEAALADGVGREALLFIVRPHPIEQERPYRIVTEIQLPAIDYENFITDMLADRQFIEDHGRRCKKGEVWDCLLVRRRGQPDGVLVMPEDGCFVGWAAYFFNGNAREF